MEEHQRAWGSLALAAAVTLLAVATIAGPSLAGIAGHPSTAAFPSISGAHPGVSFADLQSAPHASVAALSGAPATAMMTGPYSGATSVFITFALTNGTQLNSLLADLADPQSGQYHHYLTEPQFIARYSPTPAPYAAAVTYFGGIGGLHVLSYSDRIGLLVQGPAKAMGEAFGVSFASFTAPGRGSYYGAVGGPTLPMPIAASVVQVEGLSSYLDAQSLLAGTAALPSTSAQPSFEDGYPAPSSCGVAQCLYGSDLQVAYNEQPLLSVTYPSSERVATILWAGCTVVVSSGTCPNADLTGSYDPTDVYSYYNDTIPAGQPHSTVIGIPFDGAPPPGVGASYDVSGAVFENTLDVDMVGSLAPGSTIYNVYGLNSLNSETDAAMGYILTNLPSVNVITNSWGGSDHVDSAWSTYMQTAAARGITVLAASGDSGDSPFSSRWVGGNTQFPSSVGYDTYGVTAVGGTTLTVNANAGTPDGYLQITNQTAWYNPVYAGGSDQIGSSGGVSTDYAEPSWQADSGANAVILSAGVGANRGVPDIAAIANNTVIYLTVNGGASEIYDAWGTSVASPVTAGMIAEIDAVLARYSAPSVGFINPAIYTWANAMLGPLPPGNATHGYLPTGGWNSTLPSAPFYDVRSGMNFAYDALYGYDLVTGWGSLDAYNFTTFILNYNYSGHPFSLNGVGAFLDLSGLAVTSPGVSYNASIQQNLFLANSLGAPLYWVQNVIYIAGEPGGWAVNYTGWVIFPFYGLYASQTVYEYNFPITGANVTTPINWTIRSWLSNNGLNAVMNFQVNDQRLQLPVPGAAFIIGGYNYQYYWHGTEISNGPFPNTYAPGGLAPQFGLVGGPRSGQGNFQSGTAGNLTLSVEMSGQGNFVPAPNAATFGDVVDQTGEIAQNLVYSGTGAQWALGVVSGGVEQGVVTYTVTDAGNPANQSTLTYAVNFTESGLPTGTSWSVTFDGVTQTCQVGTTTGACGALEIGFQASNGSYTFVTSASGYTGTPSSGPIDVNGMNVTQPIVFTVEVTYAVTFTESGLGGGVSWTVTLNSVPQSSTTTSITFQEPDGQYLFSVSASGYQATPASGSVTVSGAPVNEPISFSVATTFSLTFTETGLPNNQQWSITLSGQGPMSSSTSTITFVGLTNGPYSFSVGSVSGYSANPSSGTVTISGSDQGQSIQFTSGGGGGGNSSGLPTFSLFGLSGTTLYITLSVIIIACLAVALVAARRARRRPPPTAPPPMAAPPPGGTPPLAGPTAPPTGYAPAAYAPTAPPPPPSSMPPPGYAAPAYYVPPPPPPSAPVGSPSPIIPFQRACPRCGSPVGATSRFCPNCGGALG